jgi:hypothetical protein
MRYPIIAAFLVLTAAPALAQTANAPDAMQLPNTADTQARSPAAEAQATVQGPANDQNTQSAKQQQMARQMDEMRGVDHGPGGNSGAASMSTQPPSP